MPEILLGRGATGAAARRYFRLLLIGYFEGLDAERAIAWRAADSFAFPRGWAFTSVGPGIGKETP